MTQGGLVNSVEIDDQGEILENMAFLFKYIF